MSIQSSNTKDHLCRVVKSNAIANFNEHKVSKKNKDISCIVNWASDRILFIRDVGLGDILMTLPTVRELKKRYPNSTITYASKLMYHELLADYNFIDNLEDVSSIDEKLNQFDKVYDIRNKLENYRQRDNQCHRVDSIAKICGIKLSSKDINLKISKQTLVKTERLFEKYSIPRDKKLIAVVTKGTFRLRTWPLDYVIRLCLLSSNDNFHYLLLCDDSLYGFNLSNVTDLTGKLDLNLLTGVISKCDAVISPDTGTLHVSGALEIPTIGLFGSIPPEIRTMYYKNCYSISARGRAKCSPCFDRQFGTRHQLYNCTHKDVVCMRIIKPIEVYNRLKYILFQENKLKCDFCGTTDLYFYNEEGRRLAICNHCDGRMVKVGEEKWEHSLFYRSEEINKKEGIKE